MPFITRLLPLGIELGIYSLLTEQINRIKSALTDISMKEIWDSLCKEDIKKATRLVLCLFQFQNDFHHGLHLRHKHVSELKSAEKITYRIIIISFIQFWPNSFFKD